MNDAAMNDAAVNWDGWFDPASTVEPPAGWPPLVLALWHEAHGDWERAHDLCNADESRESAWVHAYLHRVEGDLSNADYWYRRAGRTRPESEPADERRAIATALLG